MLWTFRWYYKIYELEFNFELFIQSNLTILIHFGKQIYSWQNWNAVDTCIRSHNRTSVWTWKLFQPVFDDAKNRFRKIQRLLWISHNMRKITKLRNYIQLRKCVTTFKITRICVCMCVYNKKCVLQYNRMWCIK